MDKKDLAMCKLGIHTMDNNSYRCSRCGISALEIVAEEENSYNHTHAVTSHSYAGLSNWVSPSTVTVTCSGTALTLDNINKAVSSMWTTSI